MIGKLDIRFGKECNLFINAVGKKATFLNQSLNLFLNMGLTCR